MDSPFFSILSGKNQNLVVAENSYFVAVIESSPQALGHVVLVSKRTEDSVFALPEAALASLMPFASQISKAIQQVVPCEKVGLAIIGLITRHAHIHLVPLQSADDLNFTRAKLSFPEETLNTMAIRIRNAMH